MQERGFRAESSLPNSVLHFCPVQPVEACLCGIMYGATNQSGSGLEENRGMIAGFVDFSSRNRDAQPQQWKARNTAAYLIAADTALGCAHCSH